MVKCSDNCCLCCLYCIYAIPHMHTIHGKEVLLGVKGCSKHPDEHHQSMARTLGYCKDFYCLNAREEQDGT